MTKSYLFLGGPEDGKLNAVSEVSSVVNIVILDDMVENASPEMPVTMSRYTYRKIVIPIGLRGEGGGVSIMVPYDTSDRDAAEMFHRWIMEVIV